MMVKLLLVNPVIKHYEAMELEYAIRYLQKMVSVMNTTMQLA